MAAKSNFVSAYRAQVVALVTAADNLRALKRQWDTLGFSGNINSSDLGGVNADLVTADIGNAITSAQAIDDFCTANFHWANLEKMKS